MMALEPASVSSTARALLNIHPSEEEWEQYLHSALRTKDYRVRLRGNARAFVRRYPDLTKWSQLPLRERVGWNPDKKALWRDLGDGIDFDAARVNYAARPYLLYLGFSGRLELDWGWILAITTLRARTISDTLQLPLSRDVDALLANQQRLGMSMSNARHHLLWTIPRLLLRHNMTDMRQLSVSHFEDMRLAVHRLPDIPGIAEVLGGDAVVAKSRLDWLSCVYTAGVAMYHAGMIEELPKRNRHRLIQPVSTKKKIAALMDRYLAERQIIDRPATMQARRYALRRLSEWVAAARPEVTTLDQLTRDDLVEFMGWMKNLRKRKGDVGAPVSHDYVRGVLYNVAFFFHYIAAAEWDGVPMRPPIHSRDVPKPIHRLPRSIPPAELEPLLDAIRDLECPYQRCALLVARWSGARREEIRKLHLDCLGAYPDGTARLRLAAGKSRAERVVPLHEEAAEAIRTVIALRQDNGDRPIYDADLGRPVRYLFLKLGVPYSAKYLFESGLEKACTATGLLTSDGRRTVHPHRFRHTLGTELGEKGARLQTIMKVLGHRHASMSMTYINMSDPAVLADYSSVLTPGAVLAGRQSDAIRNQQLSEEAIDWLKSNFLKTELELGRCLRLPQEGPCECDLYLSCSKFVTTPAYADRLRHRVTVEDKLIADAQERGRDREVERHQRIRSRVIDLLTELDEPVVKRKPTNSSKTDEKKGIENAGAIQPPCAGG